MLDHAARQGHPASTRAMARATIRQLSRLPLTAAYRYDYAGSRPLYDHLTEETTP